MAKDIQKLIPVRPAYQVNRGAVKCETGLAVKYVLCGIFDTAGNDSAGVSNKTVAAHGTGAYLPKGAIITEAFTDAATAFTSATSAATIAIKAEGTGDLVAGVAISASPARWGTGLGGCLAGNSAERTVAGDTAILAAAAQAAAMIKTTVEREIIVTVGVEALTAGKMAVLVEYYIGL